MIQRGKIGRTGREGEMEGGRKGEERRRGRVNESVWREF